MYAAQLTWVDIFGRSLARLAWWAIFGSLDVETTGTRTLAKTFGRRDFFACGVGWGEMVSQCCHVFRCLPCCPNAIISISPQLSVGWSGWCLRFQKPQDVKQKGVRSMTLQRETVSYYHTVPPHPSKIGFKTNLTTVWPSSGKKSGLTSNSICQLVVSPHSHKEKGPIPHSHWQWGVAHQPFL